MTPYALMKRRTIEAIATMFDVPVRLLATRNSSHLLARSRKRRRGR